MLYVEEVCSRLGWGLVDLEELHYPQSGEKHSKIDGRFHLSQHFSQESFFE